MRIESWRKGWRSHFTVTWGFDLEKRAIAWCVMREITPLRCKIFETGWRRSKVLEEMAPLSPDPTSRTLNQETCSSFANLIALLFVFILAYLFHRCCRHSHWEILRLECRVGFTKLRSIVFFVLFFFLFAA